MELTVYGLVDVPSVSMTVRSWLSMEKTKLGSQDIEITRNRYRLPFMTLMIERSTCGPPGYRPLPLIKVESASAMPVISTARVWYLKEISRHLHGARIRNSQGTIHSVL